MRGWVANLATEPFSNDTRLMEAIAAGQCDVGIVNTYYFGRLLRDKPTLPLKLFWADQARRGRARQHFRRGRDCACAARSRSAQVSRVAVAAGSAVAVRGPESRVSGEPGRRSRSDRVAAWGEFKASPMNVAQAGELQATRCELMDRAGYR